MKNISLKCQVFLLIIAVPILAIALLKAADGLAQSVKVTVRWLEVQQTNGNVAFLRGQASQPARRGMRLQSVGDGVRTGSRASVALAVDTNAGFIRVAEQTNVRIAQLRVVPGGGRVTQLQVSGGQVRVQVRRYNNSGSRLEIKTPSGISGIRGTEFGVVVQPDGKTGLTTLSGAVESTAQGVTVLVKANFQNVVVPNEKPSQPVPLRNDSRLNIYELTALNDRQVRIVGQTDAVNLLNIANQTQNTDRVGRFDIKFALPSDRRVPILVRTPLGKEQRYELLVP
jgi:hypothetical protein